MTQEAQPYAQNALVAEHGFNSGVCTAGLTLELLTHDLPLLHQEPVFPANESTYSAPQQA